MADGPHGEPVAVHGSVADGYEPVRDAFVHAFAARGERGAALAVHHHGRLVVDLWAGTRDEAGAPWTSETAGVLRSATKGPAAAVLHLLHQRGQLDLDAPVGTYWPEFKAAGKDRVLVRHLLAHRAGLPALDRPLSPAQALDGVSGPAAVAAQPPAWEPGTAHGYHPYTYGWLLEELVLRVTGRRLGRWFADEVAGPLGLPLRLGLPARARAEVAELVTVAPPVPPAAAGMRVRPKRSVADAYADPASLTSRAFGAVQPRLDENSRAFAAAGFAAAGGIATARALSAFYASLIGDLTLPDGTSRRLFTPATLTQARTLESDGPDRVLVVGTRFGLGFMLHGPASPMLAPGAFGQPGRGGSLGMADPASGLAVGYVTRVMHTSVTSDPRPQSVLRALRTAPAVAG